MHKPCILICWHECKQYHACIKKRAQTCTGIHLLLTQASSAEPQVASLQGCYIFWDARSSRPALATVG